MWVTYNRSHCKCAAIGCYYARNPLLFIGSWGALPLVAYSHLQWYRHIPIIFQDAMLLSTLVHLNHLLLVDS